jgi:cysteine desulfuration protein SufE
MARAARRRGVTLSGGQYPSVSPAGCHLPLQGRIEEGAVAPDFRTFYPPPMPDAPRRLADIHDEYDFLDADDRYRLLIELGRALEPMPEALKTDATLVRGCSASVWVYPTRTEDGALHFLADSNAAITKGIIALVLATVQDRTPAAIVDTDIAGELAPFDLGKQLSSNRTQGIPNMIALIRETAGRYVT